MRCKDMLNTEQYNWLDMNIWELFFQQNNELFSINIKGQTNESRFEIISWHILIDTSLRQKLL